MPMLYIVPRPTGTKDMMQCLIPMLSVVRGTSRQILPATVAAKLPWMNLRTGKMTMAMTKNPEKRIQ